MLLEIILIAVVISLVVLIMSVVTISKAYSYEHKVDPLPNKDKNDQLEQETNVQDTNAK